MAGNRAELERLLAAVPPVPGVWVEDKGLSATVHYRAHAGSRRGARPGCSRRSTTARPGPSIELREGRMSVELRPVGLGDKGTALRALAERFGLRGLVVLGDDMTDLDMFRAAAELRSGGLDAAILAVGGHGEVPPRVGEAADAVVARPGRCRGIAPGALGVRPCDAVWGAPRRRRPGRPSDGRATR